MRTACVAGYIDADGLLISKNRINKENIATIFFEDQEQTDRAIKNHKSKAVSHKNYSYKIESLFTET